MEQSQQAKTVSTAIIVILLILGTGFLLSTKYRPSLNQENLLTTNPSTSFDNAQDKSLGTSDQSATVIVKNTPMINGVLSVPAGFPPDIPLESSGLTESATTKFLGENTQQLSISYQSSKTTAEKYEEYKGYLRTSGYQIKEGDTDSAKTILGTKEGVSLSVAIGSRDGGTLVQLSYLLKSVPN